jgi:hypothetical protein
VQWPLEGRTRTGDLARPVPPNVFDGLTWSKKGTERSGGAVGALIWDRKNVDPACGTILDNHCVGHLVEAGSLGVMCHDVVKGNLLAEFGGHVLVGI